MGVEVLSLTLFDCRGSAPGKQTVAGRCLRSVVLGALGSTQLAAALCSHVGFLQG